jgi:hypothetical protein
MEEKAKLWTRDFSFISLAKCTLFVSFQMLLPALPTYASMYLFFGLVGVIGVLLSWRLLCGAKGGGINNEQLR